MGAPGSSLRLIYGVASAPSCPLEQMCPAQGVTQGPTRLTYGRAGARTDAAHIAQPQEPAQVQMQLCVR